MVDYREELYGAKYHLAIARRMLVGFDEYGSKRFLVGVIREGAKASGKLVRAFLIKEGVKGNLNVFVNKVAPLYLDVLEIEALVGILNLERDQTLARVELLKGDKVLLEVGGRWRVLRVSRLREFVDVVDDIVRNFPTDIKR